jgi:membrane dipeptidase
VTLPEMRAGGIGLCLATLLARTKPSVCPAAGFNRRDLDFRTQSMAYAMAQGQLAYYRALEQQEQLRFIRTSGELREHWQVWTAAPQSERLGIILAMEGADPIMSPAQAEEWFAAGLRCVGMAHYGQGIYAHGTGGEGSVTLVGRELLHEFEQLGMIVDLTHCAEPGFFEVLDRFSGPVHASHNMCRALVPADRQFSDDQIRALLERNAVIGMALDAWMLYPGWKGRSDEQRGRLARRRSEPRRLRLSDRRQRETRRHRQRSGRRVRHGADRARSRLDRGHAEA